MNIKLWPVNVCIEHTLNTIFTAEELLKIIEIGESYEQAYPLAHVPAKIRNEEEQFYNLLENDSPIITKYKSFLKEKLEHFAKDEGYLELPSFEVASSIRKFTPGDQVKPHTHRSVDYVSVLWLSLEVTDSGKDTYQKIAGNRFQIMDPVPLRNRLLNHNMLCEIAPKQGTFVIHPSHLFHTTEPNLGSEETIALVTNIKVTETVRTYTKL